MDGPVVQRKPGIPDRIRIHTGGSTCTDVSVMGDSTGCMELGCGCQCLCMEVLVVSLGQSQGQGQS